MIISRFKEKGIIFTSEEEQILVDWYKNYGELKEIGVPVILAYDDENFQGYLKFIHNTFEGFPCGKMIPLWEFEDMSAFVGYYYEGPLKGTIAIIDHDEVDISPKFYSLKAFYSYFQRVVKEGPANVESECWYEKKFIWEPEINGGQGLSSKESEYFYQVALDLLEVWKSNLYPDSEVGDYFYSCVGYCIASIIPEEYADLLIPYLNREEDEYVLEAFCLKIKKAKCQKAYEAIKQLAEYDGKTICVGGWTNGHITKEVLKSLE